jgi:putative ABC transport system permease protein
MLQDLRFAIRMLVKDPGFTFVAALALALGIGMNTTVFTLVNAVLIRGLPYEGSHELFHIDVRNTVTDDDAPASWPEYVEWRDRARSFSAMAGFRQASVNISETDRPPERVSGALMTPNTFGLLRVQPVLGRDFQPEDGQPNAAPVVLIGHTIWANRYGSDPNVLGKVIRVNDVASTIVGVMPPGMRFPQNHDLWRPLIPDANLERRTNRSVRVVARLAPGVSRADAQAEISALTLPLQQQYPESNKDMDAQILTFNERANGGPIRMIFLALLGAVGFVLLIACANVANLLLSRSTRRGREVAIRFALGASRFRVVRQLLIESTLLAFIGGGFGLLLAWGGTRAFDRAVADVGKPYWITFTMDPIVFGYMALICLGTGLIFGAAPALQVSKTNVNEILKEGGRGAAGGRKAGRMRSVLVVAELALTVVLLIGAGLMVRSFLKLYDVDLGTMDRARILTMRADLPSTKYTTPEQRRLGFERILANIQAIPGVRAAALTESLPFGGGGRQGLEVEGRPVEAGTTAPDVSTLHVTPTYFETMAVSLRTGRSLTETDGTPGNLNVVVNETFLRRFFPREDAIGRRVRFTASRDGRTPASEWMTIVGVSPVIPQGDPQALEPSPVLYHPYRQRSFGSMSVLVATHGAPAAVATDVRRAVQAADPDQPVYNVRTMEEALAQVQWPYRVFGSMFAIFALVALALSAVGIYAVTSYAVTQRTAEIGVRMALGAQPAQVWWMILRSGLLQLGIGLTIGLGMGWMLSGVLQAVLVQIPAQDPVTFMSITALLAVVMIVSCLVPARRATRLDPIAALRVD